MCALEFMDDLRSRLAYRIQLTTDGYTSYQGAVEGAFGGYVDYAQAVKLYDDDSRLVGTRRTVIVGAPSLGDTTTSHVERHNLDSLVKTRFEEVPAL